MAGSKVLPLTPRYAAIYMAVFILLSWGFMQLPTDALESLTAQTSSAVFNLLGLESTWSSEGQAQISLMGEKELLTVSIIRECTAINVFGVAIGLILPLRTSRRRQVYAILLSAFLLFAMNISRIMLTLYLTGYTVPPFSWYFQSPTVETYHYPISFAYGVIGVAVLILALDRWIVPELGDTLLAFTFTVESLFKSLRER
jgi:exosortase/archaeosortase family protein